VDEEGNAREGGSQNSWADQVEAASKEMSKEVSKEEESKEVSKAQGAGLSVMVKGSDQSKEMSKEVPKEEESKEVSKKVAKEEVSKEALKEDENQNGNPARQGLNRHNGC